MTRVPVVRGPWWRFSPGAGSHRLRALLRLAVAVGLLAFLLSRVSASQLLETLSSARGSYLLAAVTVSLLIELVLAARLRIIARAQQLTPTFAQTLPIDLAAKFYGLFAPGGNFSGSAIRAYKLTRLHGDALGSVASIVFDRLIATASLGFVGQVFWVLERPPRAGSVGLVLPSPSPTRLRAGRPAPPRTPRSLREGELFTRLPRAFEQAGGQPSSATPSAYTGCPVRSRNPFHLWHGRPGQSSNDSPESSPG